LEITTLLTFVMVGLAMLATGAVLLGSVLGVVLLRSARAAEEQGVDAEFEVVDTLAPRGARRAAAPLDHVEPLSQDVFPHDTFESYWDENGFEEEVATEVFSPQRAEEIAAFAFAGPEGSRASAR